jgi:hypothetical protein
MQTESDSNTEKRYDFMRDYEELKRRQLYGQPVKREPLLSKGEWAVVWVQISLFLTALLFIF